METCYERAMNWMGCVATIDLFLYLMILQVHEIEAKQIEAIHYLISKCNKWIISKIVL